MVDIAKPLQLDSGAPVDAAGARGYCSISQAAALLGVSRVSIWRWIRAGVLPAHRLGRRTTRISREDLEHFLVQIRPAASRSWVVRGVGARAQTQNGATRAPGMGWKELDACRHFVQFYDSDGFLLDAVGDFIATALRSGDAGIVIATSVHREGLEERLQRYGLNMAAARARGRYLPLDAAGILSKIVVDGTPDPRRFTEVVAGIVARAAAGGRRVRVFGEMVALLVAEGNHVGAIRLETLWNDLQQTHDFSLFCAYPMYRLSGSALAGLLRDVCAQHSRVIPAESYTALPEADERLRAIVILQQKAASLEAEIAERKRVEHERSQLLASERAAREEAEAALRLRDEFLSIASHELRTPLTTLSAQAQLALRRFKREGRLEPDPAVQTLQAILGQADRLSRLITQLLDVSRLESGKLTLQCQPTDLTILVEQAVAGARAWSEQHSLTTETPESLEAQVDPLRLEQVLTNLLDNAIKYSPDGGPIEVVLSRPRRAVAELSVRDRGLGVPAEKRGQIFERFYQAHGNGHKSGMGLGLSISRQIVELHGGEIRAEFPTDGGTRVVVRLPIQLDEQDAASGDPSTTIGVPGRE